VQAMMPGLWECKLWHSRWQIKESCLAAQLSGCTAIWLHSRLAAQPEHSQASAEAGLYQRTNIITVQCT